MSTFKRRRKNELHETNAYFLRCSPLRCIIFFMTVGWQTELWKVCILEKNWAGTVHYYSRVKKLKRYVSLVVFCFFFICSSKTNTFFAFIFLNSRSQKSYFCVGFYGLKIWLIFSSFFFIFSILGVKKWLFNKILYRILRLQNVTLFCFSFFHFSPF